MADVARPSQPQRIPSSAIPIATPCNIDPPSHAPIPSQARSFRNQQLTPLDTLSPVTQYGSFEFDRIIKQGEVHKRTRKTKVGYRPINLGRDTCACAKSDTKARSQSWKAIFIVLRPNILSIYRDRQETKLRHQVNLSELTAVARQKDQRHKDKHVFALFSPSRNYHLEASSDKEAQEWVEKIRDAARIDQEEEEMILKSPGGAHESTYQGFERSIDAQISPQADGSVGGYMSSSDAENLSPNHAIPVTKTRDARANTGNTKYANRRPSYYSYSGAEGHGSYSDFSDIAGPTSRLSALSLAQTDPRPSTSSTQPVPSSIGAQARPSVGMRSASQMSNLNIPTSQPKEEDSERVVHNSWVYYLKSHRGVRQWKKYWLVVRPKGLAFYKGEDEYMAALILPLNVVTDAVEIDPISKSKHYCMQIISEERNYRFSCQDEESLTRCLGSLKSLLSKQKIRRKEKEMQGLSQSVGSNTTMMPGAS